MPHKSETNHKSWTQKCGCLYSTCHFVSQIISFVQVKSIKTQDEKTVKKNGGCNEGKIREKLAALVVAGLNVRPLLAVLRLLRSLTSIYLWLWPKTLGRFLENMENAGVNSESQRAATDLLNVRMRTTFQITKRTSYTDINTWGVIRAHIIYHTSFNKQHINRYLI